MTGRIYTLKGTVEITFPPLPGDGESLYSNLPPGFADIPRKPPQKSMRVLTATKHCRKAFVFLRITVLRHNHPRQHKSSLFLSSHVTPLIVGERMCLLVFSRLTPLMHHLFQPWTYFSGTSQYVPSTHSSPIVYQCWNPEMDSNTYWTHIHTSKCLRGMLSLKM